MICSIKQMLEDRHRVFESQVDRHRQQKHEMSKQMGSQTVQRLRLLALRAREWSQKQSSDGMRCVPRVPPWSSAA